MKLDSTSTPARDKQLAKSLTGDQTKNYSTSDLYTKKFANSPRTTKRPLRFPKPRAYRSK